MSVIAGLSLAGCGLSGRLGAGVSGSAAQAVPEVSTTLGITAGDQSLQFLLGTTGGLGIDPASGAVGRVAGGLEVARGLPNEGRPSDWGLRGGLFGGAQLTHATGASFLLTAKGGPSWSMSTSASDPRTSFLLEGMVGVSGVKDPALFWGLSLSVCLESIVIDRIPVGG